MPVLPATKQRDEGELGEDQPLTIEKSNGGFAVGVRAVWGQEALMCGDDSAVSGTYWCGKDVDGENAGEDSGCAIFDVRMLGFCSYYGGLLTGSDRSDCTPFTMAGYVGEDVEQAVQRLLVAANHDVRRAETGIICLDEFDKIAKPKSMAGGSKDISGEVAYTSPD